MAAFTAAERDALAKSIFTTLCIREPYAAEPGKWVTIGGGPGPGGEKHTGGTPVKLSPDGKIAAGPDNLEGRHIDAVDQGKKEAEPAAPPPATPPAPSVPGAPKAGGPSVSHEQHAAVKNRLGPGVLAAYEHEGAYYFLHDDAQHAAAALDGATAVTRDGLKEALGKLIDAGHNVGIAAKAEPTPPVKKASPATPLLDQPATKPPESPAAAPEAKAATMPAVASKSPAKPRQKAKPPQEPDDFRLKGRNVGPEVPKGRQVPLFDKLRQDDELAKAHPTAAAIARGTGTHRLANQLGEAPPPGITVTPDGIWTGTATLHAGDIKADPKRFQYKISGVGEKGVTKELAEVKQYNPLYGGQLLVWRDPENGQTYVINGHHRHELASRSEPFTDPVTGLKWAGEMQSYYIPAKTAAEARAIGAKANMAEGRGTATDAAKFLRDSGESIEHLQASGISLRGKIAADAQHLRDLSDRAFQSLAEGRLAEGRALAVARDLKDPELQNQLLGRIEKREQAGKAVPDSHVAEMAKEFALAGKSQGGQLDMFGEAIEDSLIDERADLKAALRGALTSERNIFKSVSTTKRAAKIQEGGKNALDVEGNRERTQQADEALFLFDRLANSKGPLADAIQTAAQDYRNEPKRRKDILERLQPQILDIIQAEWGSVGGKPAGEPEHYTGLAVDRPGSPQGVVEVRGATASGRGARTDNSQSEFSRRLADAIRRPVERYTAELADPHAGRGPVSDPGRYQLVHDVAAGIREYYSAQWAAGKHPRGQPENAGQFASVNTTMPSSQTRKQKIAALAATLTDE